MDVPRDCAKVLSLELWHHILSFLVGGVANESDMRFLLGKKCLKEQSAFYRLRLVCKTFNDVFLQYPHLCRGAIISRSDQRLSSFLLWLQRFHGSVETYADYTGCDECVDAIVQQPSRLTSVLFGHAVQQSTVKVLARSQTLRVLELVAPVFRLDINDLHVLSSLDTLTLHSGEFAARQLPEHLTSLNMASAVLATRTCACVSSIRRLRLSDSILQGVHPRGASCLYSFGRVDMFGKQFSPSFLSAYWHQQQQRPS